MELVAAGVDAAAHVLPREPVTETRYGVGFIGVHDGRGGNVVFAYLGDFLTSDV